METVRRQDRHRSSFTVYVDNLPNRVGFPWFHKFFSNFGVIKDLHLPNRRSKRTGNRFGFIRFESSKVTQQAVIKGNGIWVGRTRLIVERAAYDMPLSKEGFSRAKGRANPSFRIERQSQDQDGEFLPQRKEIEKRQTLNIQPIASEWLTRSAVAKLKVFSIPECIQNAFMDLNFKEVKVKSLGGMNIIISFHSKEDRLAAIRNPLMANWFSYFKPWNGEVAGVSRLVWLNCRGMPLSVWNALTFKSISALWGDLITLDESTLKEESYEVGRMIIVTECDHKIDEWINITVRGRNHRVRVWEEDVIDIFSDKTVKDWARKQQLLGLPPLETAVQHNNGNEKVWRKKQCSGNESNSPPDPSIARDDEPSNGNRSTWNPNNFAEMSNKQDKLANSHFNQSMFENVSSAKSLPRANDPGMNANQEEADESNVGETPELRLANLAVIDEEVVEKTLDMVIRSNGSAGFFVHHNEGTSAKEKRRRKRKEVRQILESLETVNEEEEIEVHENSHSDHSDSINSDDINARNQAILKAYEKAVEDSKRLGVIHLETDVIPVPGI